MQKFEVTKQTFELGSMRQQLETEKQKYEVLDREKALVVKELTEKIQKFEEVQENYI